MSDDSMHDLLPWFLTGTLEPAEAEAFRRHLEGCAECRKEQKLLSEVRDAVEREGPAYLTPHPGPERLVAFVAGELDGAAARETREHIGVCPTCALESRWVGGDRVAGDTPGPQLAQESRSTPERPRRASPLMLAGAAAAVLIVAVGFVLLLPADRRPEIPRPHYLTGLERTAGVPVVKHACDRSLLLILPVDVAPGAFPVTVAILDDADRPVLREAGVSRDLLIDGVYLPVLMPAEACRPGDYRAVISGASGETPIETQFRIERP